MKLNIGCATNVFPGWVNIDRDNVEETYFRHIRGLDPAEMSGRGWSAEQVNHVRWLNAGQLLFVQRDLREGFPDYADGSVDAIYLGQIVEHLNPIHELPQLLRECYRLLKEGGRVRITTPDLDALLRYYNERLMSMLIPDQPAYYADALREDQLAYIMFGAGGTSERYEGHQHLYTLRSMIARLRDAGISASLANSDVFSDCIDKGMSHSFALEGEK